MSTDVGAQALREAEAEVRAHIGTLLACLLRVDMREYASYPLVLGDLAGRMETADRLAAMAAEREQQTGKGTV